MPRGKNANLVTLRLPPELRAAVDRVIARSIQHRRAGPWTLTDFLRSAIADKLSKMERSRTWRRKRAQQIAPPADAGRANESVDVAA